MRRALIGLAVAALTVLSLAGPASAAPGHVRHFRFHGAFADATWFISNSATSFTETFINVSKAKQGSALVVDQLTGNLDAEGNFTGGTLTVVHATSGFSFAIHGSASASGSGLPTETCTVDTEFNTECTSAPPTDVNATWTGQGPITRGVSNQHSKTGRCGEIFHSNGTIRGATADATVGGLTPPGELTSAELGTVKEAVISFVC